MLLFPGRAVARSLLHRLALVRRSRLPTGLPDDAAESGHALHAHVRRWRPHGSPSNLNIALKAIGNVRPVFTTREGIQVTLPGGRQLRSLALGAALLAGGAHRTLSRRALAGMADVALRRAVRRSGSDPWPGRVAFTSSHCPSCGWFIASAQTLVVLAALSTGAIYLVSGHLTSGFPAKLSMSPVRAPAPHSARRRLLRAAGVGRMAAAGRAPDRIIRSHSRRQLRRRVRAHAGGACF